MRLCLRRSLQVSHLFVARHHIIGFVLLVIAAFLPRVFGLGQFITSDEANFWLKRSNVFLQALQTGQYAATAISTHPGVTTMWLGSAGILLRRALQATQLIDSTFTSELAIMQLPVALVHAIGVVGGYALLRRMWPSRIAWFAALLWALDPFVIGFSRLLHVDALAGTFSTLSLLAACLFWHHEARWRWLLLSGVCAGLAMLSKSPMLALLPTIGGVALAAIQHPLPEHALSQNATWWRKFVPFLLWGAVTLGTIVACWPALWVDPIQAYRDIRLGVVAEGAQPHMLGNFFLGQEDDAPGLSYYPVALALRLTPWVLSGLLFLPVIWRYIPKRTQRDLTALSFFPVFFVVVMSFFPKKFDRYLVPVFPALDLLAAWCWMWAIRWSITTIQHRLTIAASLQQRIWKILVGSLVIAAAMTVGTWHGYWLLYASPLLGGEAVSVDTFTSGWGEGLEQAAGWLNQQPDITSVIVASTQVRTLQPYLRANTQAVTPSKTLPKKTGYVVIYRHDAQGGPPGAPFDTFYLTQIPDYTVRIHGVDFVWIYRVPPPVAKLRAAIWKNDLSLRGYTLLTPFTPGTTASIHLAWATGATIPQTTLFAHLISVDGQHSIKVDIPGITEQWQSHRYPTTELHLPIAANIPNGQYQLYIGWYDPATSVRLPLIHAPAFAHNDGSEALLLTDVTIGAMTK